MEQLDQLMVGWFTVASGTFWILQLVALLLLYAGRRRFGPLSDLSSAMSALLLIPLALVFRDMFGSISGLASLITLLVGLVGMLAVATAGFLMASQVIEFRESLPPVVIGMGLVGIWMVVNSFGGLDQPDLPPFLPWLGIVVGVTLALALPVGLFRAGDLYNLLSGMVEQPGPGSSPFVKAIVYVGGPINQLLYPIWAFWLGRLFLSGAIP